jgi:hypothetical protein
MNPQKETKILEETIYILLPTLTIITIPILLTNTTITFPITQTYTTTITTLTAATIISTRAIQTQTKKITPYITAITLLTIGLTTILQ